MENQVGSINFDANALYLEEESEHEDEKQQDNEIKELISQGGLDGILDDESILSSSADSSAEEDDSENEINLKTNYHHQNQEHDHDLSVYNNLNQNANPNNYLINHFSTPANNQNPPNPQHLQATAIPNIQEDKLFYRQRKLIEANKELERHDNTVAEIDPNDVTQNNADTQQYLNLQKQHYVSHSKMHSLDRFAVQTAVIQPHHEVTIKENEELGFRNSTEIKQNKIPIAQFGNGMQIEFNSKENENTKPAANYGNFPETSIIDLNELNEEELRELHDEEQRQQQEYFNVDHLYRLYCQSQFLYKVRGKKLEEVSNRFTAYQEDVSREMRAMKHRVNLAEKERDSVQVSLDQAHDLCNQYKAETEKAQKTCAETQDKFEKLKQSKRQLELKLDEQEQEIENLHIQISEQQKMDTLERMQQQHEHIIQQLRDQYEKDLYQIKEAMAQNQKDLDEKHQFINILRMELDQANKNAEIAQIENAEIVNRLNKNFNDLQAKYNQDVIIAGLNKDKMNEENKNKLIEQLSEKCRELETELKSVLERTSGTNQIQSNDSFDFHISNLSNTIHMMSTNESIQTGSMKSLQNELERALNLIKQKRNEIQAYQLECDKLRNEIVYLKQNGPIEPREDLKPELEKLNRLIDELNREKTELVNELSEKNSKLDQLLDSEEQNQHFRSNLELELFNKQNHCQELEKIIDQLHQELSQKQQIPLQNSSINEQKYLILINEYEAQISDLNLKLANRENEIQKCREMYIEICNDKNNLQDTLKQQYDDEYDAKIKQKLDLLLANKLDEQKSMLNEKWTTERTSLIAEYRKQIDTNLTDLKTCREKLIASEKFNDQLRVEKTNLEIKTNRLESELKEKILNLERIGKDTEDKLNNEISSLKTEYEIMKIKCESDLKKSGSELNELRAKFENEKQNLLELIDNVTKEKNDLNVKLEAESLKVTEMSKINVSQKEAEIKNLESQLVEKGNELSLVRMELTQKEIRMKEFEKENKNCEAKLSKEIEVLNTQKAKLEAEIISLKKLNEQIEASKVNLLTKKEEESQKCIQQLEDRFKEDYDRFVQTYKESVEKALNEKTTEFSKEKDELIKMYQNKYNEYEDNEKSLLKQIRELKEKDSVKIRTDTKGSQTDLIEDQEEYIGQLADRIRELEEILSNTDAHFEFELNKLRTEFEEEFELKLKQELENGRLSNYRDESVEQGYRIKLEQLQEKYQNHLDKMKEKYESDLNAYKQSINENYKKALLKSKTEIENLQNMVGRYKKNSFDSEKLIDSLKAEMRSMKESHLDELTNLKITCEKEKETLKDNYEQSVKKIASLEKELSNNDERFKTQLENMKQQLKSEYGIEMSKLNQKMQDMMKSHSLAVEKLKRQHQKQTGTSPIESSKNFGCQTYLNYKDIDLLETVQNNYLNTLSRMKSDMLNEFNAQSKSIKEFVREKIREIFMPKIEELLKEFRVSDTMVRIKLEELESDLDRIIMGSERKKPDGQSKRSSTSRHQDETHNNLYSKSASILRDLEPSENDSVKSVKKSGSIILSSGYKYTPLRQSWSNLSQMNTLSPASVANFDSPVTKKFLEENMNKASMGLKSKMSTRSGLIFSHMEEENCFIESLSLDEFDKEDKDYVYVDDTESVSQDEKASYFKKYQNIRQKKTQKNFAKQLSTQRPHSASLIRSTSNFVPNQSDKSLVLTRSHTNVNTRQLNADIMKPKTNLSIHKTSLSKQSLFENEEERPTKPESDSDDVMSEMSSKSLGKIRTASSILNSSTRSSSSIGIKTVSSNMSAFCSNSLPRSRTPNGSSLNSELMGSGHSYRSATLSSINKSVNSSNENIHSVSSTNFNTHNSVSTTSTHYHPISSNIGVNLIKNSAPPLPQQPKKKTLFF